jgi:hypothetical protein
VQSRDLGAALVGFTAAYTWQVTLRYLMAPSAVLAALLITGLGLFAVSVAVYVTAVIKKPRPQSSSRRLPRPAKQASTSAASRPARHARPVPTAHASAAV